MNSFLFNHRFIFMGLENKPSRMENAGEESDHPLSADEIKALNREEKLEKFTTVLGDHHHIDFHGNQNAERVIGLSDLFDSEAVRVLRSSDRREKGESVMVEATRGSDGNYYDTRSGKKVSIFTGDIVALRQLLNLRVLKISHWWS